MPLPADGPLKKSSFLRRQIQPVGLQGLALQEGSPGRGGAHPRAMSRFKGGRKQNKYPRKSLCARRTGENHKITF